MDYNLAVGIFVLGYVVGSLVTHAQRKEKPTADVHSGTDDVEKRARRAF